MFEAKNSKSESLHALVWSVGEDDVRHVTVTKQELRGEEALRGGRRLLCSVAHYQLRKTSCCPSQFSGIYMCSLALGRPPTGRQERVGEQAATDT